MTLIMENKSQVMEACGFVKQLIMLSKSFQQKYMWVAGQSAWESFEGEA